MIKAVTKAERYISTFCEIDAASRVCTRVIHIIVSISLVTTFLFILTGCAYQSQTKVNNSNAVSDASEIAPISRTEVIKHYQLYLNEPAAVNSQYYYALRRLADLELEEAEDNINLIDTDTSKVISQYIESAIDNYLRYLKSTKEDSDKAMVYYQLAKAYTLNNQINNALDIEGEMVRLFPNDSHIDEIEFRRGEQYFKLGQYQNAEQAYGKIVRQYSQSRFYEKAIYKLGWTYFKLNKYRVALNYFTLLLDLKLPNGELQYLDIPSQLSTSDRSLVEDILYAASLAFFYLDDTNYMPTYFTKIGVRSYEAILYSKLTELYIESNRITDAALIFTSYIDNHKNDPLATSFNEKLLNLYVDNGNVRLTLLAKEQYARRFGVNTQFWQQQAEETRQKIKPKLVEYIRELAKHYHARSIETGSMDDVQNSKYWYKTYIDSFPEKSDIVRMNFLLGEMLFSAKQYALALEEYEKTAYQYKPHIKAADAGYSALVCYQKLRKTVDKEEWTTWRHRYIESSLKFADTFPLHVQVPEVLTSVAEELYLYKEYARAQNVAQRILNLPRENIDQFKKTALMVSANAYFDFGLYKKAESVYSKIIQSMDDHSANYQNIADRLVDSIYKQGEAEKISGNYQYAAYHFMRAGNAPVKSKLTVTALYDAGVMYIKLKDWNRAIITFEAFREQFPNTKFTRGVMENLAQAYSKTAQRSKAASELLALTEKFGDARYQKNMMWLAADMYHKDGNNKKAAKIYKYLVEHNPPSLMESVEAFYFLAEHANDLSEKKKPEYWLRKIINSDKRVKNSSESSTTLYAAKSALKLAQNSSMQYKKVSLKAPLKKSMRRKLSALKKTLKLYEESMSYNIADVFTEAAVSIADLYIDFANALRSSDRPKGLSAAEMSQYDMMLDEQIFPFEEKAIKYYEMDVQQTKYGFYDTYIKKSYKALSDIVPARYSKPEKIISFIEPIK